MRVRKPRVRETVKGGVHTLSIKSLDTHTRNTYLQVMCREMCGYFLLGGHASWLATGDAMCATQSIFISSSFLYVCFYYAIFLVQWSPVISHAFFFVWRRWGKDEERDGTSLMILALSSYRGGVGVANWIRSAIRASKSKRGFLSRGLLLKREGEIFKLI